MGWTDIHSHILPGFDDGAADEDEFLEMARSAASGGTSTVAATPHYDVERPGFDLADIPRAVSRCNRLLDRVGVDITLVPGVEVRINAGLFEMIERGAGLEALGLGRTRGYMLVDLPLQDMPVATPDILFRIGLAGFTPILAHPERNRYLVDHKQALDGLVQQDVLLQVDTGSITGIFGDETAAAARKLLARGYASVIASDAHSIRNRTPDFSEAVRMLGELSGEGAVEVLMDVNPARILQGKKELERLERPDQPDGSARKSWLRRFTR